MTMRSERFEELIAAPLERVWWALTTDEGLASWFGVEAEVDLRIGGKRRVAWGEVAIDGVVTDIDPNRRVRIGYLADGVELGAEEWLLEADGDVVRLTLISSMSDDGIDDWEGFYGDMRRGWTLFMASCRHALTNAASAERTARMRYIPAPGDRSRIWDRLEPAVAAAVDGLEPLVVDPPHSRLFASADRTVLVDIEGAGEGQVVYVQVAGHPTLPSVWADEALSRVGAALVG